MQNIETKIDGNKLTVVIDLSKTFGPSKSGKSTTIASTQGNQQVAPGVSLGVNVYKR